MTLPFTRALVTGSTGFIGTHLGSALREQGIEVHGLGLPSKEHSSLQNMHEGDITDSSFLQNVFTEVRPEAVFHLAAYGTFGNEKDTARMVNVNISGTNALLDASIQSNVKTFVMAGSAKEYATGRIPIPEEEPVAPWDDYAATKAAAAFFCRLATIKHALPTTVLRLSPAYGPGDSLARFIPLAIAAALLGDTFTVSAGSLVRNFTYIDDVVNAFLLAAGRSGTGYEVFNIASLQASSFDDVLGAVETATKKEITKKVIAPSSSADDSWVLDASKAKKLLGWEETVTLEEGIARTVEWYTANQL